VSRNKKKSLRKKLTYKYRLVILNDDTLEEKLSFKLNRLNVYVLSGLFAVIVIVLTTILIAYTPLKEYIPGYTSTKYKKKVLKLETQIQEYDKIIKANELYITNVQNILSGNIEISNFKKTKSDFSKKNSEKDHLKIKASTKEAEFREKIEEQDKFSIFNQATKSDKIVFFAPLKGEITQQYNSKDKHYAIDIAVPKNTPVKSVADGTVIFADFTPNTGNVIIIEHPQSYLSVYKHNATIFKNQGDLVKSGEVIANAGSTGSLTSGTHLHFELWNDGYPIDPTRIIDFK
jgi:murein DD-endopeptidase MepM/ murein hydrolase activator NlpD